MMKKWTLAAVSACLLVGLAACQSGSGPAAETKEPALEKTKITYWTFGRPDADYKREKIAKFEAANPDIEVEMTVMAENYNQSLDLAFASNQAPDVFDARPSNIPTFYKKGYLEPLDGYMTDEHKKKFAGLLVDQVNMMDGQTFSFPNTAFTSRLIYNVDLFEKAGIKAPPTTMQEMVEIAAKLTEAGKDSGAYGFGMNLKNPSNAYDKSIKVISEISGIGGQGYNFQTGKYDFTGHKPILEALRQIKEDGSMIPGAETLDIDPLRAQFAEGKIGMYLSLSAEVGVYRDQFPAKIRWSTAIVPSIDGNVKGAMDMLNGGTWLSINKNSPNKDKAWKFFDFMYSDEVLQGYYETGQGISIVPSVLAQAKQPDAPNIEGFFPTKYDTVWPVAPQVNPEGLTTPNVYANYILGGGDLDKLLEDLGARYNAALDKGKSSGAIKINPMPDFDPISLQGVMSEK